MIHLVVGKIGGGKSSLLQAIYTTLGYGDGVINQRVYHNGSWIGQNITRLSTGEKSLFSIRDGYASPDWDELWHLGTLSFSRSGMSFAESVIEEIIEEGVVPVFIDEIGPLELNELGFHQQFLQLLNLGRSLYVAVREECLDNVVRKYNLRNFSLIPAKGTSHLSSDVSL